MGTHQVIESLFILKQGAGHPVILPACCAAASAADCGSLIVDGIVVAAAYRGPGVICRIHVPSTDGGAFTGCVFFNRLPSENTGLRYP